MSTPPAKPRSDAVPRCTPLPQPRSDAGSRCTPPAQLLSDAVPRCTRRQLLQAGALAPGLILATGLLGCTRGRPAEAEAGLLVLSGAAREILTALAPVVLAGSLPDDPPGRARAVADILHTVDGYLAHLPPALQAEAEQVFALLQLAPARVLAAGVWSPWADATAEELATFLEAWRTSAFRVLRNAYVFLQSMLSIGWFDQPAAWVPMGYAGPPAAGTGDAPR